MKNMQLFSCLLFATIATHCMESSSAKAEFILSSVEGADRENNPWKKINCKTIESSLNTDYNNYLKNRLEEYKKTDFTVQDMSYLTRVGTLITGNPFIGTSYKNDIRDEYGDNFIRIAVKKQDLPIVYWLVNTATIRDISRDDFDACFAICTKHLHPLGNDEVEKKKAYDIIKTLTLHRSKQRIKHNISIYTLKEKPCRENLIKQLILLQIKHKKYGVDCMIEDEYISQHLTSGEDDQSPILLTDMYQTVTNKKGNTLSHVVVNNQNPDELYELIKKNYVSPAANKNGKTVLDIALNHFQSFIQDFVPSMTLGDIYPGKANQARCCLFMLLTYIKSKQTRIVFNHQCCDKHFIDYTNYKFSNAFSCSNSCNKRLHASCSTGLF